MLGGLIRGSQPAAVLRRLPLAGASAGVGFLLLAVLGHAMRHPGQIADSLTRLAWCSVPFAAAVQLSVAVARAEPGGRPLTGLDALGAGPARTARLAAASATLTCLSGSAVAFAAFLQARAALAGPAPLPVGGVLTLLLALPLAAGTACLLVLRPRRRPAAGALSGLPWGLALAAAGLALEVYAHSWTRPREGALLALPAGLGRLTPALLLGWALTAAALVVVGPGLVRLGGQALAAHRPGALRLLAGRALQEEAERVGRPLGVLCGVASAALAVTELYRPATRPPGVLTLIGAALLVLCPAVCALAAALEARHARRAITGAVAEQGASAALLRRAVALRTAVALTVLAPVTWAVGQLAALPLSA